MKYFEAVTLAGGKRKTVYQRANNRGEAVTFVESLHGATVLKIKEIPMPLGVTLVDLRDKIKESLFKEKLNKREFNIFLRQISVMTNAGIPLREALFESMTASGSNLIKKIGAGIIEDVDSGMSLTESFKKFEDLVGHIVISMIDLGEKTGSLAESIDKLVMILEEIEDNKMKVKKGMRMPLISLGAMGVAFVVLIMMVIPKFKAIFDKFGGELPLPTRILMGIEAFLNEYGLFVLIGIIIAAILFKRSYKNVYAFRLQVDKTMLKVYLIGDIVSLGMYSRFMLILAELIRSGIPLNEALQSASMTIDNAHINETLRVVPTSIQRGTELSEGFAQTEIFENMVISMIKAGESGGELDKMLNEIAKYYKSRFQNMIDNIATLIEPMMMAIIAVLVLILALGIFLPMWELSSVVNK